MAHGEREAAVEQRLEEIRKAQELAWSLQRGGKNVGQVYARQAYGDVAKRIGARRG